MFPIYKIINYFLLFIRNSATGEVAPPNPIKGFGLNTKK